MRRILSKIIFIAIFLTGFSVMMYPTVSNWVNERNSSRVVSSYDDAVTKLEEADYSRYWEDARAYNQYLADFRNISDAVLAEREDESDRYESLLNVGGSRIMGVLQIPKIKVSLPIYHSTDESVLQVGIGHYEGSSLPIGGEDTHSVLSGHRGLPSATLLTDLDQVEVGDRFYVTVLKEILAYEVQEIEIVNPEDVDGISIRPGEDLLTLVTCTPYGINSHRLLVTGTRVPYNGEMEVTSEGYDTSTQHSNPAAADEKPLSPYVYMGGAVFAAGLLGFITRFVSDMRRKRKRAKQQKNTEPKDGERS